MSDHGLAVGERIALVVLAAGESTRFEGMNKLDAKLGEKTLLERTIETFAPIAWASRHIVVSRKTPIPVPAGFTAIINAQPGLGMGHSIAIAAQAISAATDAEAMLIALADMPFVGSAHIVAMLTARRSEAPDHVIASCDERGTAMPPALFPHAVFGDLAKLSGTHGARRLLIGAHLIGAPDGNLIDIDTRQDYEACRGF